MRDGCNMVESISENRFKGVRLSLADALHQVRSAGFIPKTVVDVGVASGTSSLYETYPEARFLLIEPLEEFVPAYKQLQQDYRLEYVITAVGSGEGRRLLHVHSDYESSSLFPEQEGTSINGTPREVPVTTLDRICAEKEVEGSVLLKLDVQGYEMEVLRGSAETLLVSEVVAIEVSLFEFYKGSPSLKEIVNYMAEHSFVPYDIVGQLYRPLDGALAQVDVVFVRENGLLRESHHFATPEQRASMQCAQSYKI